MSNQFADGGGESRPPDSGDEPAIIRYEEEATAGKRWQGVGSVGIKREIERGTVRRDVPRQRDQLVQERIPPNENDSGRIETLPDGSLSVPLFEEELVVTKRTVLRERVIIRKETLTEWETVEAELRREQISLDTSDLPEDSVENTDAG